MRFFIERTSTHEDVPPCEEATPGFYMVIDRRTVDDPTKLPQYRGDPQRAQEEWYGEGTNHHVEDGCIIRDLGEAETWYVEIQTLEDLIAFQKKYGMLVLQHHPITGEPVIEIYDNHRE